MENKHASEKIDEVRIHEISEYDFFSGDKESFKNKISTKSVLRYGVYSERVPLISILIPTYKRVNTLKDALQSALNQKGFDDYEILVVDNEGADLDQETDTERYIKEVNNSKVIYYRHEKSVTYRMVHAANLARTKWICFLHDDDILSANALYLLHRVVQKHPDITWLSPVYKSFANSDADIIYCEAMQGGIASTGKIIHYPGEYCCTGHVSSWLGALIDRENYINMGAEPDIPTGCGDFMMIGKYGYKYGIYLCETEKPLYFYRVWDKSLSAAGTIEWYNNYIEEFLYYRYCAKKFHKVVWRYWEYMGWQFIKDKIFQRNHGLYQTSIDEDDLREKVHVPARWSKRGVYYKVCLYILYAYRKLKSKNASMDIEF